MMSPKQTRPVYLNLLKIRLPVTGVTSIAHRVSGALLFLSLPLLIYGLDLSVQSSEEFANVANWLQQPLAKVVLLIWIWSLVHHLLAGIRFLLIDLDVGVSRDAARQTAWWVNFAALGLVLVLGGALFL